MSKATTGRRTGSARVNPIGTPSQAPAKAPPKIDLAARYQDCISGEPIGRDVPFEERERKLQKCWILSSNETETKVYKSFNYKIEASSQNPAIMVSQSLGGGMHKNWELLLGSEHMTIIDSDIEKTVPKTTIQHSALTLQNLQEHLKSLNVPSISDNDLEDIRKNFEKSGIDAFGCAIRSDAADPISVISPRGHALPAIHEFRSLVEELRQGNRLTIVRNSNALHREVIDKFWRFRLDRVLKKGIYPDYEPFKKTKLDDSDQEKTNLERYLEGDLELPRLPWMQQKKEANQDDEVDENAVPKCGLFPAKNSFTSLKEWHIVQALGLASEVRYQQKVFAMVFNSSTRHEIKCEPHPTHAKHWHTSAFLRTPEDLTLPSIPDGTTFKLTLKQDVDMDSEVTADAARRFEMRTVASRDNDAAFVLEWQEEKDKEVPFKKGFTCGATLDITFNMEPSRRQFAALTELSKVPRGHLRNLLIGQNYDNFETVWPLANYVNGLNAEELTQLENLLNSKQLNYLQWQGFDLPLFSEKSASCQQGPPGTGKSFVISLLAAVLNSLRSTVVVTGPSRASVKAVGAKIAELVNAIKKNFPLLGASIGLTILPTKKESEEMALADLKQIDGPALSAEDAILRPFQWFTRAIEYGVNKHAAGQGKESDAAWEHLVEWVTELNEMNSGTVLSIGRWRRWWKRLHEFYAVIDEQTTMLISTCNNLGSEIVKDSDALQKKLKENGVIIIDEAAFDQEYSIAIPLSLPHRQVFMVGDHAQLEPIVGCKQTEPFAKQTGRSIFARTIALEGAESVILKITYRLHERLADVPGVLSYGGLVSEHSKASSASWEAYANWLGPSKYGRSRRTAPPRPTIYRPKKLDFRRMLLNVRGRSGKAPDSMSTVNYANINAICDYVQAFLTANPNQAANVVVQVPFSAQRRAMQKQFDLRFPQFNLRVRTIDSFQGGENDIVILCLTSANWNDPAFVGFLTNWNRLNVAITRPKQALLLVGNIDLWRQRIEQLHNLAPEFAKMILDIVDKSDILDLPEGDVNHYLPKDDTELSTGNFSLECPQSQPRKIEGNPALPIFTRGIKDSYTNEELRILRALDGLASKAADAKREIAAQNHQNRNKGATTQLLGLINLRKKHLAEKDEIDLDLREAEDDAMEIS